MPRALDGLVLITAAIVVIAHMFAGILDEGRPVLHPVGHGTVLVMYTWILAVCCSLIVLAARRGRSWPAVLTLGVTLIDVALLLTR